MRSDKQSRIKALEAILDDHRVSTMVVFVDPKGGVTSAMVPHGATVDRKPNEDIKEFIARARRLLIPEPMPDPKKMSDEELDRRLNALLPGIAPTRPNHHRRVRDARR